jgi:uncharacterized membrane protein
LSESVERETARVEAFSDGVFAIAVTLLVLEFKVPQLPGGGSSTELFRALLRLWPSLIAFLGSFIAVLIMWINHHGLFRMIHKTDSQFLMANGFLLLMVTFVPFPTAVLSEYLGKAGERAAATFYVGTFIVIAISWIVAWDTATRRQLLKRTVSDLRIAEVGNSYRFGLIYYTACTLVALWNAPLGLAACLTLWIYWATRSYRADG